MNDINAGNTAAPALLRDLDDSADRLFTPCGDGRMVWRRWGSGPRHVVLLHGAHGSWTHWIHNIRPLAERYSVLVPDLPGMGDSADPPMPALGDDLAAILADGLGRLLPADGPPAHIAGFSFGTGLAVLVARDMADRFASLTLVCSGGLRMPAVRREDLKSWRRLTDPDAIMAAHHHNLAVMMFAGPESVDDLSLYLQNDNTRRNRFDNRPVAAEGLTLRALADVRVPVNAIWGEHDLGHAERRAKIETFLSEAQPGMPLAVIPGAGHWVQYEAADHFNPLFMEQLAAREG